MMKKMMLLLLLSSSVSFAMSNHNHHGNHDASVKKHAGRMMVDAKVRTEVQQMMTTYHEAREAIFQKKEKEALVLSKKITAEAQKVSSPELKKLLSFSSEKLSQSKNLDELKNNFHIFSRSMELVISKYDFGKKYNVFSCPMVKKKWIQDTDLVADVHNPYMPEMDRCGSQDTKF